MKQRKWNPQAQAKIILEGIKGRSIAEIYNAYQIYQSHFTNGEINYSLTSISFLMYLKIPLEK